MIYLTLIYRLIILILLISGLLNVLYENIKHKKEPSNTKVLLIILLYIQINNLPA